MSIDLERDVVFDERALNLVEEFENNRWHRLAVLAVLMEASGVARQMPDAPHGRAFAQVNPSSEDIPTVIGAASSFTDLGFDARFYGPIASGVDEHDSAWARQTLGERNGSTFREQAPCRRVVGELLSDTIVPWNILMELPVSETSELRPVVVLGQSACRVALYDPANAELGAPTLHSVNRNELLGASELNERTSLLAVRHRHGR
jgi:hypothetical protein